MTIQHLPCIIVSVCVSSIITCIIVGSTAKKLIDCITDSTIEAMDFSAGLIEEHVYGIPKKDSILNEYEE